MGLRVKTPDHIGRGYLGPREGERDTKGFKKSPEKRGGIGRPQRVRGESGGGSVGSKGEGHVSIEESIIRFVSRVSWIILGLTSAVAFWVQSLPFALGIAAGGLIVTVNFHLLSRTLKRAFAPGQLAGHNVILAKYYVRFVVSGAIIFVLISRHYVHPLGLFLGLSVIVASLMLGAFYAFTKLYGKEAT